MRAQPHISYKENVYHAGIPEKKNGIKLKYKVRNSKKTKEHMKCSYMYVYTGIIFAAVLSPTIKIFHRHLGPNL
jgi:hypothetical protein